MAHLADGKFRCVIYLFLHISTADLELVEELLRETTAERQAMLDLLHPLVFQGLRTAFPLASESSIEIHYFGRFLSFQVPSISQIALLAYTARLEITQPRTSDNRPPIPANRAIADERGWQGATLEDHDDFDRHGRTALPERVHLGCNHCQFMDSRSHDIDWYRLLGDFHVIGGQQYNPGQVQGLWCGKFLVMSLHRVQISFP